jgi:hypothetical protein
MAAFRCEELLPFQWVTAKIPIRELPMIAKS